MKNIFFIFCLMSSIVYGQVEVVQYNAGWNSTNDVEWCNDLVDCDIAYVDIADKPKQQEKHNIAVVPTIIIFDDGEEVKRYQADISFTMKADVKEVQAYIDEILANKF